MNIRPLLLVLLCVATIADAQVRPSTPAVPRVPRREGWRLVDGLWVRPEGTLLFEDLVRIDDSGEQLRLIAKPSKRVEQLLRGNRIAVTEIAGSPLAWKMSLAGRTWNDDRTGGTQNLVAVAAMDDAVTGPVPLITKIEVRPDAVVVQGVWKVDDTHAIQAIVLLGPDYTELAAMPAGELRPTFIARAGTAREMLNEHPLEGRQFMLPLLRPLTRGRNPLQPAAGDVYRAFHEITADGALEKQVDDLIPQLASRDSSERNAARTRLHALGRLGVQAALKVDRSALPPEPAAALEDYIRRNTSDPRQPADLLADRFFLSDCMTDPDPRVAQAVVRHLPGMK